MRRRPGEGGRESLMAEMRTNTAASESAPLPTGMSWHALPTELHLAIVRLLPQHDVLALSATASTARALCLPAIFASVVLPSTASLMAFARHVPSLYGLYVRSLAITTEAATDVAHVLAVLAACTRLQSLSLSLAAPIDPENIIPAFSRLVHVHTFQMGCGSREEVAPVYVSVRVSPCARVLTLCGQFGAPGSGSRGVASVAVASDPVAHHAVGHAC